MIGELKQAARAAQRRQCARQGDDDAGRGRRGQGDEGELAASLNVGSQLQAATRKRGVVVRASNDNLVLSPPLIMTKEQADEVIGVVGDALEEVLG